MYSVRAFGRMMNDQVRVDAYTRALEQLVKPGDTVVDIGTGTGHWAIVAAKLGASKIYAIEPNSAIQVAELIAQANGVDDRIQFIKRRSDFIELPERVDGIVSDLRGQSPLALGNIQAVADARSRFLKSGGWICAQKDIIWGSLIDSPKLFHSVINPWRENNLNIDLSPGERWVVNQVLPYRAFEGQKFTRPRRMGVIDYSADSSPDFKSSCQWTVSEKFVAHGFVSWFDTLLADGIGYSTSPLLPSSERAWVYGNGFHPLKTPLALERGDQVELMYEAIWRDRYFFRWSCDVTRNGRVVQSEQQSSFACLLLDASHLRRVPPDSKVQINQRGKLELYLLSKFSQGHTIEDCSRALLAEFPQRFRSAEAAYDFVASGAKRFCR